MSDELLGADLFKMLVPVVLAIREMAKAWWIGPSLGLLLRGGRALFEVRVKLRFEEGDHDHAQFYTVLDLAAARVHFHWRRLPDRKRPLVRTFDRAHLAGWDRTQR